VAAAVAAIIAVAGTLLGSALTYMFQLRASQRAEAAAFQRELRAERTSAYGAFLSALTEWKNEQINWYSRREDDSGGEIVQAARIESYRLKGIAQAALSRVQLVASSQALVIAADQAFELTRPIHSARDETDLEERKDQAMKAVNSFIALAATDVQSAALGPHYRAHQITSGLASQGNPQLNDSGPGVNPVKGPRATLCQANFCDRWNQFLVLTWQGKTAEMPLKHG